MLSIKIKSCILLICSIALAGCSKISNDIVIGDMNYQNCKVVISDAIKSSSDFEDFSDNILFNYTNLDEIKMATLVDRNSNSDTDTQMQQENLDSKVFENIFPSILKSIDNITSKESDGVVATLSYSNDDCGMQVNLLFNEENLQEVYSKIVSELEKQNKFTLFEEDPSGNANRYKINDTNEYIEISMKNSNQLNIGYSFLVTNK